jgi:hypothetical protein
MLPSLRVNPWHVTKPRFILCLLGGRKAPHSKTLHYARQDLWVRGLTGKTIDNKILFRAIGDPYNKQLYEAKGFVKEIKNYINCVSTGYILQKPLGTL